MEGTAVTGAKRDIAQTSTAEEGIAVLGVGALACQRAVWSARVGGGRSPRLSSRAQAGRLGGCGSAVKGLHPHHNLEVVTAVAFDEPKH
eukprot:scaffold53054_cov63-Phaeocystis_antarctica.AAC.1